MSYRFTDTNKWADSWFIDLNAHEKLMFSYLCDLCDSGGFFELSTRKMIFDLGLTNEEVKGAMKGLERCYILSKDKSVLFLKNFLKHQKNIPLNSANKAHIGISKRFEKYIGRFELDLVKLYNCQFINDKNINTNEGASKPLPRGTGIGIGIGIDNIIELKEKKEVEKIEVKTKIHFDIFWNAYGKKAGDKNRAKIKWDKLPLPTQEEIIKVLPSWKTFSPQSDVEFQPFPETFINQKRWLDEAPEKKPDQPVKFVHTPSRRILEKLNQLK